VRLFVAVWPPARVVETLRAMDRPQLPELRWTTEQQWHVTLRFLGEVDDAVPVARALHAVPGALHEPPDGDGTGDGSRAGGEWAGLGPATAWFRGRQVLQVPVTGLDALARAVAISTAPWDAHADDRRFFGHITVARTRGRARGPVRLTGTPLAGTWSVPSVALVASVLGRGGSRYETLETVSLTDTGSPDP
jgi:2'-5' RNA ligase